tara:strand:- start:46 stop:168 length:123 start_codon:yes stop_codon:yes gene_type:complete
MSYGNKMSKTKKNNYQIKTNKKKVKIVMGNKNKKARKRTA